MIKITLISTILFLLNSIVFSQEVNFQSAKDRNKNKPVMFNSYADTSDVHSNFFNSISSAKLNDKVVIQITQQQFFKGKVHILHETTDYRSISIESEETPGLRIILTRTNEDKYYGIIGCVKHKDVIVLKFNEVTNKYIWIKKEMSDLIPD